jgi:hypothetical protein
MTPGFGAGLVIPDLWQQEAVRALQQGKDVVVQAPTGIGQDLHLRAALSESENSGGVHRPDPRSDNGQRFRATPTRVHARIQTWHDRQSYIISGLRWIRFCYLSFNSFRSRGGHAFPALIAARFASRIATICLACERVSSRRLASPPRLPMPAR